MPVINPAVDEIKSWGRLSFATGSSLEKVDRNVRLMTSGPLLSTVQRSPIFEDCKTFVDMPMRFDPEEVLHNFQKLSNSPTDAELREFIEHNFLEAGVDLQHSEPVDFNPDPAFARRIQDPALREFGYYIHSIWPQLFRRVDPDARMHQQRHSLLSLPYPLVVPGGRFRESYYWDTYWIVEGLLVSGMHQSVRGIIKNLLSYIESFGFVPNGGRCYYMDRSQPPMLSEMVAAYYDATGDVALLRHALPLLDREYDFWMAEPGNGQQSHAVTLEDDEGNKHVLNKFMSKEATPRPESYREDLDLVSGLDGYAASELWCNIRAAAESGWDFSSRWMADGNSLGTTRTRELLPVGLNAIMLRFERNMAKLYAVLAQEDMTAAMDLTHAVARYTTAKEQRKLAIQTFLWWPEDAAWRDYDMATRGQVQSKGALSAASWLPMYAQCVAPGSDEMERAISSLEASGLLQPAGVLTTLQETGQQWDAPNAWPPLQHMLIAGLQQSGSTRGRELAQVLAAVWLGTNFVSWRRTGFMHEKYDARRIGESGGGGEYTPQTGFGWTNGVVLKLLDTYGEALELTDGATRASAQYVQSPLLGAWESQPEAVMPRQLTNSSLERLTSTVPVELSAVERASMLWHGVSRTTLQASTQAVVRLKQLTPQPRELLRKAHVLRRRRERASRQRELANARLQGELREAVRSGWLICQSRPYTTSWHWRGGSTMDWKELSGRSQGRRRYQFGDLSRFVHRRVRGPDRAQAPKFKYAVLSSTGTLSLYDPTEALRPDTTDDAPPDLHDGALLDAEHPISLELHGAGVRTLWAALPCAEVTATDECELPDEQAAHAVTEAVREEMAALGVREDDSHGRPLHTFTVASAAIGSQHPKTWRLAAHSLSDAESWATALADMSVGVLDGEPTP